EHQAALAAGADAERARVLEALRMTGWNLSRAAARLGVPRNTLSYRMEKLRLGPRDIPAGPAPPPSGAPPPRARPAATRARPRGPPGGPPRLPQSGRGAGDRGGHPVGAAPGGVAPGPP